MSQPEPPGELSPPPAHREVSIEDQVSCAKRELKMRKRVYARLVAEEKMSFEKSEREINGMTAIVKTLEEIGREESPQREMFE